MGSSTAQAVITVLLVISPCSVQWRLAESVTWVFCFKESSQAVVNQLEQLQVKMDRLEQECRNMRNELEEEESNAQEVPKEQQQPFSTACSTLYSF